VGDDPLHLVIQHGKLLLRQQHRGCLADALGLALLFILLVTLCRQGWVGRRAGRQRGRQECSEAGV
jgi:hypothetical protein